MSSIPVAGSANISASTHTITTTRTHVETTTISTITTDTTTILVTITDTTTILATITDTTTILATTTYIEPATLLRETMRPTVPIPVTPAIHSEAEPTTKTVTSSIISTSTKYNPSLTTPPAKTLVATNTITIPSTIIISDSNRPQPPLSDSGPQRTITGLAVTLAGVIIIAFLAWLFLRRRKKTKRDPLIMRRTSEPEGSSFRSSQSASRPSHLTHFSVGDVHYVRGGPGGAGVAYTPYSQTTLGVDGNEEFFPRPWPYPPCDNHDVGMAI